MGPLRRRARGEDEPGWKKLVEIARLADRDDPWRNPCREALLRRDRAKLEKLADTVPIRKVSPKTLWLLATTLQEVGALDGAMALLRRAQRQYPSDLLINDTLGWYSWTQFRPPLLDDALRFYSIALSLRPTRPQLHGMVRDVLNAKGDFEGAVEECTRVIELDSKNAAAWHERGWYYQWKLGENDKALDDFSRAIELNPKYVPALIDRGANYIASNQYDKALADLNTAVVLDEKAGAQAFRGWAYSELGQDHKALANFTRAIELNPKNSWAIAKRGGVYCRLREYEKGFVDYSRAIDVDPENMWMWNFRAVAYHGLHQYDKALADWNKSVDLDPKNSLAWSGRGLVYGELGEYDKALAHLNKAVELNPRNAIAWTNRGFVYQRLGDYDKALANLNKAIELKPRLAQAWNIRGVAQGRLNHWDAAVSDVSKALKLQPDDPVIQSNLAMMLAIRPEREKRDPRWAVELAEKAVRAQPTAATFQTTLGVARYRAEDGPRAVLALQEALKGFQGAKSFQPGVGRSLFFLAMAHQKVGHGPEARKAYEGALAWLKTNRQALEKYPTAAEELRRFQAESEEVLGIGKKRKEDKK